jgi:hypothetical protein
LKGEINQKFILRIEAMMMTAVMKIEKEPVLRYYLKSSSCWVNPKQERKIVTIYETEITQVR